MPDEKTAVSEIVTGLGATGASPLDDALFTRPRSMFGVDQAAWVQVMRARLEGRHPTLFAAAWANGRAFLEASDGLRCRIPLSIEWKGPHKPPGYDSLPADLRIDHVFLVSCKYGSTISANSSPSNVFDRLLADRRAGSEDWYGAVARSAYGDFYGAVRAVIGGDLPQSVAALRPVDVERIQSACKRRWPADIEAAWRAFSFEVAAATSARWRGNLRTKAERELMLWRLLRLETSPYFVLGATKSGEPLRYRVATPWDWRQSFELRSFEIAAVPAGQPLVSWQAVVRDLTADAERIVAGEIEVRWSHGRFSSVEAKLHLKTPPADVPGYFALG